MRGGVGSAKAAPTALAVHASCVACAVTSLAVGDPCLSLLCALHLVCVSDLAAIPPPVTKTRTPARTHIHTHAHAHRASRSLLRAGAYLPAAAGPPCKPHVRALCSSGRIRAPSRFCWMGNERSPRGGWVGMWREREGFIFNLGASVRSASSECGHTRPKTIVDRITSKKKQGMPLCT